MKILEIIEKVKLGIEPPFRPMVPAEICDKQWLKLMSECWNEDPVKRPGFERIQKAIKAINGGR